MQGVVVAGLLGAIWHTAAQNRGEISSVLNYKVREESYRTRLSRVLSGADFDLYRFSEVLASNQDVGTGRTLAKGEGLTYARVTAQNGQTRWVAEYEQPIDDVSKVSLYQHPECNDRLRVELKGTAGDMDYKAILTFTEEEGVFVCADIAVVALIEGKKSLVSVREDSRFLASTPPGSRPQAEEIRRLFKLNDARKRAAAQKQGVFTHWVPEGHRELAKRLLMLAHVPDPHSAVKGGGVAVRVPAALIAGFSEQAALEAAHIRAGAKKRAAWEEQKKLLEELIKEQEKPNNYPDGNGEK